MNNIKYSYEFNSEGDVSFNISADLNIATFNEIENIINKLGAAIISGINPKEESGPTWRVVTYRPAPNKEERVGAVRQMFDIYSENDTPKMDLSGFDDGGPYNEIVEPEKPEHEIINMLANMVDVDNSGNIKIKSQNLANEFLSNEGTDGVGTAINDDYAIPELINRVTPAGYHFHEESVEGSRLLGDLYPDEEILTGDIYSMFSPEKYAVNYKTEILPHKQYNERNMHEINVYKKDTEESVFKTVAYLEKNLDNFLQFKESIKKIDDFTSPDSFWDMHLVSENDGEAVFRIYYAIRNYAGNKYNEITYDLKFNGGEDVITALKNYIRLLLHEKHGGAVNIDIKKLTSCSCLSDRLYDYTHPGVAGEIPNLVLPKGMFEITNDKDYKFIYPKFSFLSEEQNKNLIIQLEKVNALDATDLIEVIKQFSALINIGKMNINCVSYYDKSYGRIMNYPKIAAVELRAPNTDDHTSGYGFVQPGVVFYPNGSHASPMGLIYSGEYRKQLIDYVNKVCDSLKIEVINKG